MSKRIVTLGTWEDKPIEWIVLKEDNFGTLIFSRLALFSFDFTDNMASTWRDSKVRSYLNKEFYNTAFTEDEKKKIINTFLEEPELTRDNVFLLSKDESENLMTIDERKCGDGTSCNNHTCNDCYKFSDIHGTCVCLRTQYNSICIYSIYPDGELDFYFGIGSTSIRPAMWIREK